MHHGVGRGRHGRKGATNSDTLPKNVRRARASVAIGTSTLQDVDHRDVPEHFGAYRGVVVDNADPEGDARCRIEVVGVIGLTDWAYPVCTVGGGSPQRGGFVVPDIGADVIVWFVGGDLEQPIYTSAHWSRRNGERERPKPALDVPPAEAYQVQSLQLGSLCLSVDERQGQRKFVMEDLDTGDAIVWDLDPVNGKGLRIKMTTAIVLECEGMIVINGTEVVLKGRNVRTSSAPV